MRTMPAPLEHMQDGVIPNGGGNRLAAGGRCDRIDRSANHQGRAGNTRNLVPHIHMRHFIGEEVGGHFGALNGPVAEISCRWCIRVAVERQTDLAIGFIGILGRVGEKLARHPCGFIPAKPAHHLLCLVQTELGGCRRQDQSGHPGRMPRCVMHRDHAPEGLSENDRCLNPQPAAENRNVIGPLIQIPAVPCPG